VTLENLDKFSRGQHEYSLPPRPRPIPLLSLFETACVRDEDTCTSATQNAALFLPYPKTNQ
jgi:hypothetical protein